jgi:serine/threonine-protein kinase
MATGIDYDNGTIEALILATGERKTVRRGGYAPHYVTLPNGSGRLLFVQKGTVYAAPFDARTLAPAGNPVPLLEGTYNNPAVGAAYAVSANGSMLHVEGGSITGVLRIVWLDETGKRDPIHSTPGTYFSPRLSPDGKRVAFSQASAAGFDIWVRDLERDTLSRLSFIPGTNQSPVWTPDGRSIIFRSGGHAAKGLYWMRADGSGSPRRLTDGSADEVPYSFSPDGRLAFQITGPDKSMDLATAVLQGDRDGPQLGKPEIFLSTSANESAPSFSPDGRWIAYMCTESGRPEIYVRPFGRAGGRWQISTEGGFFPSWTSTGELFYRAADQHPTVVKYTANGDSFVAGKPRQWSAAVLPVIGSLPVFDVAPSGKRIVAIVPNSEETVAAKLSFLMNVTDELQRKK